MLQDAPFYQNSQEGIRFLVPEGWRQTANAMLPPGDFEDEVLLVRYSLKTPEAGAMMVVLVLQEKTPINIAEHVAGPSFAVQKWTPVEPPQTVDINGTQLERHLLKAKMGDREMLKDVYALRQNGRLYSFIGLYSPADEYAQQQLNRAMNSLQVQ